MQHCLCPLARYGFTAALTLLVRGLGNKCYSAVRLDNGNTLIGGGNGHCVLEVTPTKEIIWSIFQHDLPGIVLAWVTQVKRKSNGNTQIVNCHAGPDNPHIIEINAAKEVVWTWCDFSRTLIR
eukprot:COSAG02_NODE_1043_length_15014_cov_8.766007_7_plen_123_part_00